MRQSAKKKATKHPKAENPNAKKDKNNISTSTSACTSTSTTTQACFIIEEHVLSISNNQYHVRKSQPEIRDQRNFTARMKNCARKKASKQPVAKKSKLTRA